MQEATFLILTNLTPIAPREEVVYVVLFVNLLLIVAMVAVIAVHAAGLWRAWEKKVAGARLHARIVGLFSLIAALPALLLAIAATTTFSRALDNWFNQQTMSIVQNSLNVAHAYLDEHFGGREAVELWAYGDSPGDLELLAALTQE